MFASDENATKARLSLDQRYTSCPAMTQLSDPCIIDMTHDDSVALQVQTVRARTTRCRSGKSYPPFLADDTIRSPADIRDHIYRSERNHEAEQCHLLRDREVSRHHRGGDGVSQSQMVVHAVFHVRLGRKRATNTLPSATSLRSEGCQVWEAKFKNLVLN